MWKRENIQQMHIKSTFQNHCVFYLSVVTYLNGSINKIVNIFTKDINHIIH